jgi:hypothetical protein
MKMEAADSSILVTTYETALSVTGKATILIFAEIKTINLN